MNVASAPEPAQDAASKDGPMPSAEGRVRAVIENVTPCVDAGRFAAKRTLGDEVVVQADVFADGHDALCALLLYRHEGEAQWQRTPMRALGNDRWQGELCASLGSACGITASRAGSMR